MLLPHGTFLGKKIEGSEISGLRWNTSVYQPRERLHRHQHETANFCLILRGGFRDEHPRAAHDMTAGSAAFWAAGVPHAQTFHEAGGSCFNLAFPTDWLSAYGAGLDFGAGHAVVAPHIAALCRQIYRECQHHDELSSLAIEGLALQLVVESSRTQRLSDLSYAPRWLTRVVEIIDAQLSHRLTLATLACEVDVEPARLARWFRKARGMSIPDYIQRKRMERACHALLHSDDAISTIAIRLGYFDQSHFTRIFRNATGLTPGAYRQRHKLRQ